MYLHGGKHYRKLIAALNRSRAVIIRNHLEKYVGTWHAEFEKWTPEEETNLDIHPYHYVGRSQ